MRIEDAIFTGDACCGYHSDIKFNNGLTARAIKSGDKFTVMCLRDGLMQSQVFGIKRNLDAIETNAALALIESFSA